MGASGPGRQSAGWTGRQPAWDDNQPAGWDDNRLTGWDDSEPAGWKNSQLAAWDHGEPEDWNDSLSASGPSRRGRHAGTRSARSRQQRSLRMGRGWAAAAATVTASVLVAAGFVLSSGPAPGPARQAAALAAWRTPSIGTLFGSSVSGGDLAQKTKDFGHMPIIRTSYSGLPAANAWTTGPGAINNSAVIISFAAPPSTVLAGTDDAVLTRFFDTAPRGHRIYYAYYSEPEANVSSHQFTTSQYRRAWLHIAALARKARNRQLTPTLILRASDLSARSGVNWRSYLPDRHVIRTVAWDAYPAGTLTGHDPQLTPPGTFMGPAIAAAKSAGMQFGFAGFALATAKGRPAWLTTVANYLKSSRALFGLITSRTAVPATELTDRSSIKAWHSVVSRSGTVQGPISPAPLPSSPAPTTPAPSSPAPSASAPSSPTSSSPAPSSPPSSPPAPPGPVESPITSVPTGNVTCKYGPDTWSGDASGVGYSVREIQAANGDLASFAVALNANKGTTEVVGYPSDQCLIYSALPSTLTSSFDVTPPANSSGLDYEYAYDIWLTTAAAASSNNWNNDLELMIWTYVNGQVPAGSQVSTLSDGSKVWVGGNNTTGTVSVVLPKNETIGTVDIASIVSQLKGLGYVTSADNGILDVEYGIEAPYGGGQTFAVNGFSVSAKS
jgi:hypothetical protein